VFINYVVQNPMMNKLTIFSAMAGSAILMSGIVAGLQMLQVQEAFGQAANCNNNVVGACVATDDILSNNKVQAGVCAQVLAANGLCRITGSQ
jgi:hypothetical protein